MMVGAKDDGKEAMTPCPANGAGGRESQRGGILARYLLPRLHPAQPALASLNEHCDDEDDDGDSQGDDDDGNDGEDDDVVR